MLAYLLQFAALSNAFFTMMLFLCHYVLQMLSVFMLCLGLLTRIWFISNNALLHAQCFLSDGFSNYVFTPFS